MKKIDYQVERRNAAGEIFMINPKWNALNQLTSQPDLCRRYTDDIFLIIKMMESTQRRYSKPKITRDHFC